MKTTTSRWLMISLACGALGASVWYSAAAIEQAPGPQLQQSTHSAPRVSVSKVQAGAHQADIVAFSEVLAADVLTLSSGIGGKVIWRDSQFAEGRQVSKGQLLLKIDDRQYRAALARARLEVADAGLALERERHQASQAKRDWQRSGLSEKPSALTLRKPQLAAAKARLEAAKAALKQAQYELSQTQVKAPFSAVVSNRQVALGSYLQPGQALATLRSSDQAQLRIGLSREQWQRLPSDLSRAQVTLSTPGEGQNWQASISHLADQIEAKTRLRSLVVQLQKPLDMAKPLLVGEFVEVHIQGRRMERLLAIPRSALSPSGDIWYVEQQRLKKAPRKLLFSQDETLYVRQGELPDELLLVRKPLASYLDNMAVTPVLESTVALEVGRVEN